MLSRRKFLGLVGAGAAALILPPELLLPRKTFFLPPTGGWAQPSLEQLWLDYARQVVPCGAYVTAISSTIALTAIVFDNPQETPK
jgi:hypothetical protein